MRTEIIHGDSIETLPNFESCSIDSIVTDPPYELGFMGKAWDASGIAYNVELWRECLRVLKPGGHLLAFGGSRTYHRLACAVEDAGFEIRDQIMWVYGSGFPKSLDVSKAIDKAADAKREVVGTKVTGKARTNEGWQGGQQEVSVTAPATDAAKQWNGWGTALKPAHEPIVVARKPLEGTVAANVLKWGTGALNIDGCRVGSAGGTAWSPTGDKGDDGQFGGGIKDGDIVALNAGRWPANFIHDGSDEVLALFPETAGGARPAKANKRTGEHYEGGWGTIEEGPRIEFDAGSAARFFYCAKAGKKERNAGVPEGIPGHPTVKPVALMRYLIRLVTPPGGVVLDPFAGSGTTMVAATLENMSSIGIEMTDDYLPIIDGRVAWAKENKETDTLF